MENLIERSDTSIELVSRREDLRTVTPKKIAIISLCLVAALVSILWLADFASSPARHQDTIQGIDQKIETVMKLAGTSAIASTVISAIPDDTATPIADKLADFSTYFMFILCALYLEKYLVTLTGLASFGIMVPLACLAFAISMFYRPGACRRFATRFLLAAFLLYMLIPTSMKASDIIYGTYQTSIQETIDAAGDIEEMTALEENESSGVVSIITGAVSGVITKASEVLNHFTQAIAVMIVTSCVIPILVLFLFMWILRAFLGIEPADRGAWLKAGSLAP